MTRRGPIKIRGIEYPSEQAAAEALGVCKKRIQAARRGGRLDFAGVGTGGVKMSVVIRGQKYRTVKEAAKKLGVAVNTVGSAAALGRLETCGLGAGKYKRRGMQGGHPPKPIKIAGVDFASIADAARKLSRTRGSIRAALAGTELQRARLARDAREYADRALIEALHRQAEADRAGRLLRLENRYGRECL